MMSNDKFNLAVLMPVKKRLLEEKRYNESYIKVTLFQPEILSQTTQDFIKGLETSTAVTDWNLNDPTAAPTTVNDKSPTVKPELTYAIAVNLFAYCLQRKPNEKNELYNTIITNVNANPENFYISTLHKEKFITALQEKLKNIPAKQDIPSLNLYIKDIDDVLTKFSLSVEEKATILIDSGFIKNKLGSSITLSSIDVLEHPTIKKAFEIKPELAGEVLSGLPKTSASHTAESVNECISLKVNTWLKLLKIGVMQTNTPVDGCPLIDTAITKDIYITQRYITPRVSQSAKAHVALARFYQINALVENPNFKALTAEQQGQLLSLRTKHFNNYTPLKILAESYAELCNESSKDFYELSLTDKKNFKQSIINLIITLLQVESISITNEDNPLWLETLLPHMNKQEWLEISNHIPEHMWNEFNSKGAHIRLGKTVLSQVQNKDILTGDTLSVNEELTLAAWYNIKNKNDQAITETQKTAVDFLYYNIQNLERAQRTYETARLSNNTNETEFSNPIGYFIKNFLITTMSQSDNSHHFYAAYFICNYAKLLITTAASSKPNAIVSLENISKEFNELQLLGLQISDEYKQAIKESIQKSLLENLAKDFSIYDNPANKVKQFILLNIKLAALLTNFGLDYTDIVLENDNSIILLFNLFITMYLHASAHDREDLTINFPLYDKIKTKNAIQSIIKTVRLAAPEDTTKVHKFLIELKEYADRNIFIRTPFATISTKEIVVTYIKDLYKNYTSSKDPNICRVTAKAIAGFIHYRISSYLDITDEDYFYANCEKLLSESFPATDLEPFKNIFIAQINLSLSALDPKTYSTAEGAKALRVCLSLFDIFNIERSQFDVNSRNILLQLDIIKRFPFAASDSAVKDLLVKVINTYQAAEKNNSSVSKKNDKPYFENDNDKALLALLVKYHCYTKEVLDLPYVQAALQLNPDFISKAYPAEVKKQKVPVFTDRNGNNIKDLLTQATINDYDHLEQSASMSKTFRPERWHSLFSTEPAIAAADQFTILQQLAYQALDKSDPELVIVIIKQISDVLSKNPSVINENKHGYWIETLLVSMHQLKLVTNENVPNNLKIAFIELLPKISDNMMLEFFKNGLLYKLLDKLQLEPNPLADSIFDLARYELYFRFLLEATFRKQVRANITDTKFNTFVESLCQQLMYFKQTHEIFNTYYQALDDTEESFKQTIERGITKITDSALIPNKRKEKLYQLVKVNHQFSTDDAPYTAAMLVCKVVKGIIFIPLHTFANNQSLIRYPALIDLKDIHELRKPEQKQEIYAAVQKTIKDTWVFARLKWQDANFIIDILTVLNEFESKLGLEVITSGTDKALQLLPNEYVETIRDHVIWDSIYGNSTKTIGGFTGTLQQFKTFAKSNDTQLNSALSKFMQTIWEKATAYDKPMTSQLNRECADGLTHLGQKAAYRVSDFIKSMLIIMPYRIKSFARRPTAYKFKTQYGWEKGFYRDNLHEQLTGIKNNGLTLEPYLKNKLMLELIKTLNQVELEVSQDENLRTNEAERKKNLVEAIVLFADIIGLKQEDFMKFNYSNYQYADAFIKQQVYQSTSSTITHSSSNNNNSSSASASASTTATATSTNAYGAK